MVIIIYLISKRTNNNGDEMWLMQNGQQLELSRVRLIQHLIQILGRSSMQIDQYVKWI